MADNLNAWRIDGNQAQTADGRLWVDLRQRALAWSNQLGSAQVLQLICGDCSATRREVFTRRNELVAIYDGIPADGANVELRWVYETRGTPEVRSIDWLLSMQTDRLDLAVNCTCRSQWDRHTLWVRTESRGWFEWDGTIHEASADQRTQAIAVQLLKDRWYLEAIWPTDYAGIYLGRMMEYTVAAWRLAEEHLEKGVIRRMRMHACCLPGSFDPRVADQTYHRFLDTPVPLTA